MSKARNLSNTIRINSAVTIPSGDTASRPANPAIGTTRFNTQTDSLENYTSEGWLKVSVPIPTLTAVDGTIYAGVTSTLTLTGTQFGASAGTVRFTSGATIKNVTVTPSSATSATVTVPSEIYGLSAGDIVAVKFINGDGGQSGELNKTVQALPTGGTITISGGYRIHTFTSSSSFVVPSGFSATANYLIVAGGASGSGDLGGGGGGGGYITGSITLSTTTYPIVVGAGGSSATGQGIRGNNGSNSTAFGLTSIGGGAGGGEGPVRDANSGGSGGGAAYSGAGGAGTSGQGFAGGNGGGGTGAYGGGGGGGATQAGEHGTTSIGGKGGNGVQSSISGTATYYAGGGGGSRYQSGTPGLGGLGGGTDGKGSGGGKPADSPANTGGGGGGAGTDGSTGGAGGSGIVIVRYAFP